ncbi:hypothetical protein PAMA_000968 [Pampus argenteus]
MYVITQSCVLFLWLHVLTFVKSDECLLANFLKSEKYDSNFDTSNLEASYASGTQVRVNCHVGYSGFFKLICVGVNWQTRGKPCEPKSCGHPGDAQFADFHLEKGDDFVFGSQVVFTCHKGYQMISRINYRRCMAEGWDGIVPTCEAKYCSVIQVDDNIQVIGDPETANYGNVIRFSCKSNSEILNGSPEIYCDENGKWSGKVPKCEEVKCAVPVIENGRVLENIQEYKEDEVLHFECNQLYRRSEDIPSKCIKVGMKAEWSPTPVCEPIKCKLELPALAGTSYDPAFRNTFTPGETVRVTCGEKYWISTPQDTSAVSTCQANGQWTIRPICLEITCRNQRDRNVYRWSISYWQRITLGYNATYTCEDGYRSTGGATHVTCTRDGWSPDPPCEEITCASEQFENADITSYSKPIYKINEYVSYVCRDTTRQRFTRTCTESGWTGTVYCADTIPCPKDPFLHGYVVESNGTLYYTCNDGYKLVTKGWWGEAKCKDGVWTGLQQCIDESSCGQLPVIPHMNPVKLEDYGNDQNQIIPVVCQKGYRAQVESLTCDKGEWRSMRIELNKICIPETKHCNLPPKVMNAVVMTSYQKEYLSGSEVTYKCRNNYIMEGGDTITCQEGQWEVTDITCTLYCNKPKDAQQMMKILSEDKDRYTNGEVIDYECATSGEKTRGRTECVNGQWSEPVRCGAFSCDRPPSDGSMTVRGLPDNDDHILPDRLLTFSCDSRGQYLNGSSRLICGKDGKWDNPFPSCEDITCSVPMMHPHLQVVGPLAANKTIQAGHKVQFVCDDTYSLNGLRESECLETGKWKDPFPTCVGVSGCERPPPLENGDTKRAIKHIYRNRERVEYMCQNYYIMDGSPYKTCINGVWTGEMRCLKPCTVNEELMREHNIRFKYLHAQKLYSEHNDYIEFLCITGRPTGSVLMRQRCIDGVMNLPTCA